ncbi:MAG: bifunctional nuclease family protein [bacterium]|nr:bifunctional nuclease family protein [bacterium]
MILMEVKGLMMDPSSSVPIVILRSEEHSRILPIWIGIFEANAIALKLEGIEPPRPMTHDLLVNLLGGINCRIARVAIHDLVDNTFFAQIFIELDSEELIIDSRPSDAIALALRAEVPIYVAETVLDQAKADDLGARDKEKLKKWLEEVDPDDLGKYTM